MNPAIPEYATHIFSPKLHNYCIIVGVLNEGEKISSQIARMQKIRSQADIIIADGGSNDGATHPSVLEGKVTALLIKKSAERGLSVQYRMALGFALAHGYEGIITVDGNNKDGMESIPEFIKALDAGYDLVQGSRFLPGGRHENTPLDRELSIKLVFNPLMRIASGFNYTDGINGFKAFSKKYLLDPRVQPFRDIFRKYNLQYYLIYRAPRLGFKVIEIPVSRIYPKTGITPTKIIGLKGRLSIARELILTVLGLYNPK